MNEEDASRRRFLRDDQAKEARLAEVRRRLQASTPRPHSSFRFPALWRRPLIVCVVIVILMWVLLWR